MRIVLRSDAERNKLVVKYANETATPKQVKELMELLEEEKHSTEDSIFVWNKNVRVWLNNFFFGNEAATERWLKENKYEPIDM